MSRAAGIVAEAILVLKHLCGGGLVRHPIMEKRALWKAFAIGHRNAPF
jgi:hypothetical protein